ncbi:hypothetical protein CNMCM5793_004420 [Aspergillus hiratsukae]|uniref:Uncharacterized protein n=1 Tax=Aspergillus hiratsukae TaxID=1194566 RepID=A0A8H6UGH0_9EURO|nr:hypothetical protein CNMCM5793_004420 [Aspergillus hiratsukae]
MVVQLFPPRHVYFPSTPVHTCTVILLHDTNSTGAELAAALAASTATAGKSIFEHFPSCRWVFPSAQPRQTDTCHASRGNWIETQANADAVSPQQAQAQPSTQDKDKDEGEDLEAGVEYIQQIVEEEVGRLAGDSRRVVLGDWVGLWG